MEGPHSIFVRPAHFHILIFKGVAELEPLGLLPTLHLIAREVHGRTYAKRLLCETSQSN
jgi:hypothetical protein